MIPSGFIQELLTRVDIVDIVGRHVELKKAGINHKGLCPFHGEKSPSFIVSPSRQTYHCFGCGVHGDAIRFLVEHTGMGFIDAVQELAQQVGLTVPDDPRDAGERQAQAERQKVLSSLSEVMAKANAYYRAQLKAHERAIDYLKGRGLTGAVAAQYGIGYAPDSWRPLANAFPEYDNPLLEAGGLVIVHEGGQASERRYDRFRDRIMFPIRSVRGDIIGFGGRVLDKGEPKYLNSPETPAFVKGRELYGLYEARTSIRQAGYALVVEGYMDVVALAQMGLGQAVATLGTACSGEHIQKLFRFTENIVFSFDGDAAGRKAAARALEACLPHATDTRSIRFLFLPSEHDPDSYVRAHGKDGLEDAIDGAVPLSRQWLAHAADGCDLATAEGRARCISQARTLWEALPAGALRGQILSELARRTQTTAEALTAGWQLQGQGQARRFAGDPGWPGTGAVQMAPPVGAAGSYGMPTSEGQRSAGHRYAAPGASGYAGSPGPTQGPGYARGSGHTGSFGGSRGPRGSRRGIDPLGVGAAIGARRAPRRAEDVAVQMLFQHSQCWLQLHHEDHQLLHSLPPPHGPLLQWLERTVEDQGPPSWAQVQRSLEDDPALTQHWQQLPPIEPEAERDSLLRLRRAIDSMQLARLAQRQSFLAQQIEHDPSAALEYQRVFGEWRALKQRIDSVAAGTGEAAARRRPGEADETVETQV